MLLRIHPIYEEDTNMDRQNQVDMLAPALQRTLHESVSRSFPQLIVLLSEGKPVSPAQIAAAFGQPPEETETLFRRFPSLEWDTSGNLVGAGLTLRPTPHQFEVNGHHLYTWCALDTLVFPVLLGKTAHITSPCRVTGTLVRLTVTPEGVEQLDPPEAVVSLVTPEANPDIRATFCNFIHFFRSSEDASEWLSRHPGASIVPVAEAFQLGRTLLASMLSKQGDVLSCSSSEMCCTM
jgi:alkylmercury lyase